MGKRLSEERLTAFWNHSKPWMDGAEQQAAATELLELRALRDLLLDFDKAGRDKPTLTGVMYFDALTTELRLALEQERARMEGNDAG